MTTKPPFLHARILAELPFELRLPPSTKPRFMEITGEPNADGKRPALIWFIRKVNWVTFYPRDRQFPTLLREAREFATVARGDDKQLSAAAEAVSKGDLDRATLLRAGTVLELWQSVDEGLTADGFVRFVAHPTMQRLIIFTINHLLARYQSACGFVAASGHVGPVSLLDLRHLSAQLFSNDTPISPRHLIVASLPGHVAQHEVREPADLEPRFDFLLRAPRLPLWLELAHEAHALLHRGRDELSIVGFVQALEVAVEQFASGISLAISRKATVEQAVSAILTHLKEPEVSVDLVARLAAARRLRNKIIHEGLRLPFDGMQATEASDAIIDALGLLERAFVLHGTDATDMSEDPDEASTRAGMRQEKP